MRLGAKINFEGSTDLTALPRKLRAVLEILCLWLSQYNVCVVEVAVPEDVEDPCFSVPIWNFRGNDTLFVDWFVNTLGVEVSRDMVTGRLWFRGL